ncbi:hypothetical protein BJ165DRAFT_1529056 [Panaeolus papilionaceus]|nr:hypothetical protein BJ165DRAFT_1529056 [Panaeolus papilionaceus]
MGDRYIVVDDNDSGIQYTGTWSLIDGKPRDRDGNFGPTYRGTLHSTIAGQASFSYNYRGSAGRVTGSINVRTSNGATDPTWECKVDGRVIPQEKPFPYFENNWDLCKWTANDVSDGQHRVEVNVRSNGQAFLFDRFQYVASPSANIQNSVVSVHYNDPAVTYGSGWGNLGDIGRMAPDGGATMTFKFYGTGVSWIGTTPVELPAGSSTAEYRIDNNPPVTITVPGRGDQTEYSVLVFETGNVPLDHHTLTVTSRGQTSLTPLVLSRLWVRGGSSPEPSPPNSGGGGNSGNGSTGGGGGSSGGGTGNGNGGGNGSGNGSSGGGGGDSNNGGGSSNASSTPSPTTSAIPARITITTFANDGSAQITSIPNPNSLSGAGNSTSPGGNNSPSYIDATEKNSTPIGAIVGGALGGLALIALMLIALLWHKRQMKKASERQPMADQVQPFSANGNNSSDPFADGNHIYPQSTGGSAFSPQMYQHSGSGAAIHAAGEAGGSMPLSPNRRSDNDSPYGGYVIPPTKLSSQQRSPGHSHPPSQQSSYPGGSFYPQSGTTSPINSMYTSPASNSGGPMSVFSPSESGGSSQGVPDLGPLVIHTLPVGVLPRTKEQEAEADRLAAQAELAGQSSAGRVDLSRSGANGARITSYHHEDSGYRLPPAAAVAGPSQVLEYPPSYTPA